MFAPITQHPRKRRAKTLNNSKCQDWGPAHLEFAAGAWAKAIASQALSECYGVISRGDDLMAMESTAKAAKLTLSEWIRGTIHATLQR
jgi:hypothetical protein